MQPDENGRSCSETLDWHVFVAEEVLAFPVEPLARDRLTCLCGKRWLESTKDGYAFVQGEV